VKSPCASGPHNSKSGDHTVWWVETAAVKVTPSRYELAKPCVYHEVTKVVPVNNHLRQNMHKVIAVNQTNQQNETVTA
jgi:hypothetical protein